MTPLILAASLSLLAADAAQTATQPASTPAATAAKQKAASDADDQDRVICRNEEITGSRFTKRICMKKSEWGDQERRTQEWARGLGGQAATNAAQATGGGLVAN